MLFVFYSIVIGVFVSILSLFVFYFDVWFGICIYIYVLCIIVGIIVVMLLINCCFIKCGVELWVVIDILILVVLLVIIGVCIFYVFIYLNFYFGEGRNIWNLFELGLVWVIWEGGIVIFGVLIGGVIGVYLGCCWMGICFWIFVDVFVFGFLFVQVMGCFGNWFNKEFFGLLIDLFWGLEIFLDNFVFFFGFFEGILFYLIFFYEVFWNGFGVFVLLWLGCKFFFQWGCLFVVYFIWYSVGCIVWELICIDLSEIIFGLCSNVWVVIFGVVVGIVILIVQMWCYFGFEFLLYQFGCEKILFDVDV